MNQTIRISLTLLLVTNLGGCLLISPYHGQILTSRTQELPFQAWSTQANATLKVECMRTNRFGPYTSSHGPWTQVTTITSSVSGSRDLNGLKIYSASKNISLPESCWYLNNSNQWYYTSLRIIQENYLLEDDYNYYTLDRDGVSCTGESVGTSGSWTGWLNDSCHKQYTSGTPTRWLVMRTQD